MSRLAFLSVILTSCLVATAPAQATVRIHIDLTTQRMQVDSSAGSWNWPVSTARDGYVTPPGEFKEKLLSQFWNAARHVLANHPLASAALAAGDARIHLLGFRPDVCDALKAFDAALK